MDPNLVRVARAALRYPAKVCASPKEKAIDTFTSVGPMIRLGRAVSEGRGNGAAA
jgi:hypothetical protein